MWPQARNPQTMGRMVAPLATREVSLRVPLLSRNLVPPERLAAWSRERNLRGDRLACRPLGPLREV